jgi:hypothetical protein
MLAILIPRRTRRERSRERPQRLLCRDYGLQASYDTLWRYVCQELGWRKTLRD